MRRLYKLLGLAAAAALLAAVLPGVLAAPAEPTVHYKWKTVTSTAKENLTALPTNVFYEDESVRTKALTLNKGTYYEADGPHSFVSFGLYNGLGSETNAETGKVYRYGVPYRVIKGLDGKDYIGQDENLWFDIAQMPELRVSGVGAVNLSMDYMYYNGTVNNNNVAFSRAMQVYVSLDGETFLPGYVGIRSVTLLGGGKISSSKSGLLYQIETEDLLDIPGVERGSTIRKIRVMPYGDYCRTYGNYYISNLTVNTWLTREDFDAACPSDKPDTVDLGEETMRAIPLAEAERIASIAWTSPQDVVTEYPKGSTQLSAETASFKTYGAGIPFRGPAYERNLYCTRELFASAIVDGVYGYNGAGFAPKENGQNTAYGMSCAIFAYNCLSRVSRCGIWGTIWALAEPYTRILGDLKTSDRVCYTDVDVIEQNTPQQMYEHYALAKAGDVVVHYYTTSAIHIRLVRSVDVVRNPDGTIDGEASVMHCSEQTTPINGFDDDSYFSSTRAHSTYTFEKLRTGAYVAYTMTDYAQGKVEREALQTVCAPLVKNGTYTDGVHLAFASNYPIIKYTVTLRDMTRGEDLFSELKWCKRNQVTGENYESEELNALLAGLKDGQYSIRLAVHSGPLLSTEQADVPVTERAFPFTVGSVRSTPGDLNGDRQTDAKDAALMQRFAVGGYGVTASEASADLNGDGKVNARDEVLLQRHLAGGYGVKF